MSDISEFYYTSRYRDDRKKELRDRQLEAYINTSLKSRLTSVATSTTRPSNPSGGQLLWETDTERLMCYDPTYADWIAVEFFGNWLTAGAVTISQPGSLGFTTTQSKMKIVGSTVQWKFAFSLTGAGTATNAVVMSLPFGTIPVSRPEEVGGMVLIYNGTSYLTLPEWNSSSSIVFRVDGAGGTGLWGSGPSIALAAGNIIRGRVEYEWR